MKTSRWISLFSLTVLPRAIALAALPRDPGPQVTPIPSTTRPNGTIFSSTSTLTDSSTSSAAPASSSGQTSSSASVTPSTSTSGSPSSTTESQTSFASPKTSSTTDFGSSKPSATVEPGVKSADHRLAGGAVAGIAIGCSIAAALIAAGVVFLIMKNTLRKKQGGAEFYPLSAASNSPRSKSRRNGRMNSKNGRQLQISAQEVEVENALEQPKDDGTIKQSIASLFKAIEDHVDNFYLDKPGQDIPKPAQKKHRVADFPSGIRSQPDVDFAALLSDPVSRSSAIVSLICAELLDAIDFFGEPERSLLPTMVTSFLNGSSARAQDNQRSRLYLSRWRTGTAYLLGGSESPQDREHRLKVTRAIVADLDAIIGPYCKPQLENERRDHLFKLCKRAHELGLLLLSQPAEWAFYWGLGQKSPRSGHHSQKAERGKRDPLVVQPQVCRLTDNQARKLDRPLVIIECHVLQ